MPQPKGDARLISFRAVAVAGGVLHALPVVFLAVSVASAKERIHVVHNTAGLGMFAAVIALGWILAAVSPDRMIAVVLIVPHPARPLLFRMGRTATPLVLAAAAVPAVWFALSNASLQRNGLPMDPHIEMHRWTGMAAFALTMVLVAVVAGLGGPNRRPVAMVGGLVGAFFGVMSLIYSRYPGAVSTPWAIACIVWGAALAGDGYRMAREPLADSLKTSAEPA